MRDQDQLIISGHPDEWVALIDERVVASSKTFERLVQALNDRHLLSRATITHVSGQHRCR